MLRNFAHDHTSVLCCVTYNGEFGSTEEWQHSLHLSQRQLHFVNVFHATVH
jgi:hypothetical protein